MGRRRADRQLDQEAAELGRLVGAMERGGHRELIEEVRARARAEGKNVTDKLAEIIKAGLDYDRYKDLTLADAMKVMDFIERVFRNFLYPIMYSAQDLALAAELEKIKTVAQAMGFIPAEAAERLAEQRARELANQILAARQAEMAAQSGAQRTEGPLTTFIKRLAERVAERMADRVVELVERETGGRLEEMIAGIAQQELERALLEELEGGEEDEGGDEGADRR